MGSMDFFASLAARLTLVIANEGFSIGFIDFNMGFFGSLTLLTPAKPDSRY